MITKIHLSDLVFEHLQSPSAFAIPVCSKTLNQLGWVCKLVVSGWFFPSSFPFFSSITGPCHGCWAGALTLCSDKASLAAHPPHFPKITSWSDLFTQSNSTTLQNPPTNLSTTPWIIPTKDPLLVVPGSASDATSDPESLELDMEKEVSLLNSHHKERTCCWFSSETVHC